jgi:hypothetical protein
MSPDYTDYNQDLSPILEKDKTYLYHFGGLGSSKVIEIFRNEKLV